MAFWVGFILLRNGWRTAVYRLFRPVSFQELVCNVRFYYSKLLAANHERSMAHKRHADILVVNLKPPLRIS
jgi:hypothetical protein